MNQNKFIEEVNKLGIIPTKKQLNLLEKYYEILIEENKVMNLTAITNKEEVYLKHFYDSLTLSKIIDLNNEESLCDLGSGAGFPGIVLKIFYPNLKIILVDSLNKRIKFLNKVIKELNLKKIEAIHARIEEYSINNIENFDVVTARAVAKLNILLEIGIPLVKINKYFVAMKGSISEDYNKATKMLLCKEEKVLKFILPIEESERTLIKIKKEAPTPKKYPRKYGEIKKRPL